MDTSAALIAATLAPPALFGMAMLLDQLEERRHRRKLEARRTAARELTPADQLEAVRRARAMAAARANHPTARQERTR